LLLLLQSGKLRYRDGRWKETWGLTRKKRPGEMQSGQSSVEEEQMEQWKRRHCDRVWKRRLERGPLGGRIDTFKVVL
jgi:hypothetical protein